MGLFADSLRIAQRTSYTTTVDGFEGGQPDQLTPLPDPDAVRDQISDYLSTVDLTSYVAPYLKQINDQITSINSTLTTVSTQTTTTTRDANGNLVTSTTSSGKGVTSIQGTAQQIVTNSSIGDVTLSIPTNPLLPGIVAAQGFAPSGFTGTTQPSRYLGGTVSGAPTTGTFAQGDYVIGITNGTMWICTTAGSPGTWTSVGGVAPATSVVSETSYGQAAAVGTGTAYARNDHTHGTPATPVTSLASGGGLSVSASTGAVTLTNTGVTNLALGATTANLSLTANTGSIQISMSPTPSFTTLGVTGQSTLSNTNVQGTLNVQTTGAVTKFTFDTATTNADGVVGVFTAPASSISGASLTNGTVPYNKLSSAAQSSIQAFPNADSQFSMLRWVSQTGSFTDANGQQRDGLTPQNSATRGPDSGGYAGYSITNLNMTVNNSLAVSGPAYTGLAPGQYQAVFFVRVGSTALTSNVMTLQVTGTGVTNNPSVSVTPAQLATTFVGVAVPFTINAATNSINTQITTNQLPGTVTWAFSHVRIQQFDGMATSGSVQYFFANASITNAQIQSITAAQITTGTLTADITQSGTIRTGPSTGSRVEITSSGLIAYNGSGTGSPTTQILATGAFQLQSATSGTRINVASGTGIELYNGTTRTFFADVSTGNLSLTGDITATSGSFTGNVQLNGGSLYAGASQSSGQRTVFDSTSIRAYNSLGIQTFTITNGGDLTTGGNVTIGGTITVSGTATLSGTIQTAANVGNGTTAGVTMTSSGIKGYNNSSSTPVVTISATDGSLSASNATFSGTLTVGAATTLNGTLTLGTGQISSTNFTVSSSGIVNATSATLSSVTIQNTSTLNGSVTVGATLTVGGVIQSSTTVGTSGTGYKLSTTGLEFYNVTTRNFYVDLSGNVTTAGTVSLGGSINVTGQATVSSGMITAGSTANSSNRLEIDTAGLRLIQRDASGNDTTTVELATSDGTGSFNGSVNATALSTTADNTNDYTTPFSSYATGSQPSDWTTFGTGTTATFVVTASDGISSGNILTVTPSTTAGAGYYLAGPTGQSTSLLNGTISVTHRIGNTTSTQAANQEYIACVARHNGGTTTATTSCYMVTVTYSGQRYNLYKVVNGTRTLLAAGSIGFGAVSSNTSYITVRLTCIGNKITIWPGFAKTNSTTVTDSSINVAGRWGVGQYVAAANANVQPDYFGVVTITNNAGAFSADVYGRVWTGAPNYSTAPLVLTGLSGQSNSTIQNNAGGTLTITKFARGTGTYAGTNYAGGSQSATLGITNATWNNVAVNTKNYGVEDDGAMWSAGTTNWTCVPSGVYQVAAQWTFAANTTGIRAVRWATQGGSEIGGAIWNAADNQRPVQSFTIKYGPNLYIVPQAYQSSGATLNIGPHAAATPTQAAMTFLGG